MEIHEAADIFSMDEATIESLAADIRQNGLITPIETLNGKILDGRRRLRACALAGVEPVFHQVWTEDPVAYVLSRNLHRRHLDPSQRAMVGARARDVYDRQAKERQKLRKGNQPGATPECLPGLSKGDARDIVGKVVGVSGRSIDYAAKVLKNAIPEVIKAVDEGRMAISTAAHVATEPEADQLREAEYRADGKKRGIRRFQRPAPENIEADENETEPQPEGALQGVGVLLANDAINCLIQIPTRDALRGRGLKIVADWIRANR